MQRAQGPVRDAIPPATPHERDLFKRPYDSRPIVNEEHLHRHAGTRCGILAGTDSWSVRRTGSGAASARRRASLRRSQAPGVRGVRRATRGSPTRETRSGSCARTSGRRARNRDDPVRGGPDRGVRPGRGCAGPLPRRRGARRSASRARSLSRRDAGAARARDRRPARRRPRCGSGCGRDRVPRLVDARNRSTRGAAARAGHAALVPRRRLARALARPEHRHHRHGREDEHDRAHGRDPAGAGIGPRP